MKSQIKFPTLFVGAVIGICVLPFLLNLLGFDFASRKMSVNFDGAQDLLPHEAADYMFYALSGSFTHTILEWSAFCVAIMTVAMSFTHFNIKRDATTPIIGVALFCAGCMDAFHTLAADRLINAIADNKNLIPFTWAICRLFNALILVVGIGILMAKGSKRASLRFIIGVSMFFGLLAYVIIHFCATQAQLPNTMFPDSIITRPWDVGPLAIFIFAGIWVFPRFCRRESTLFSQSLFISMIPQIITQLHMAFGSTALFDNHFNIAHFLKIMAYVVPFVGLLLEYVHTYRAEQKLVENLEISQKDLVKSETEIRLLVENVLDPIITIDEKGMIRKFNPAAQNLFLWREEDILGKNVNVLMPEPYCSEHDQYIKKYLETGIPRVIGIGREVKGLRKNGTTFPLELGINEMFVDGQRIFIGM
ncbi:MAG: PAS domain S-box protein, partial [Nitrospinae bacterium]|nr:PAS domain S-box protein [Nitrospinota bacterium]